MFIAIAIKAKVFSSVRSEIFLSPVHGLAERKQSAAL
jgi:hypothetical protein